MFLALAQRAALVFGQAIEKKKMKKKRKRNLAFPGVSEDTHGAGAVAAAAARACGVRNGGNCPWRTCVEGGLSLCAGAQRKTDFLISFPREEISS